MKQKFGKRWLPLAAFALALFLIQGTAFAAKDFFLYGNQDANDVATVDGPAAELYSYFTAIDYFRGGTYDGRRLAATGTSIYIESGVDTGSWTLVAEVDNPMDPAFLKISPSGGKVAIGLGYDQDILVFNTSVLDPGTPQDPVDLSNSASVLTFEDIDHYDAAWAGEDYIVINGGDWVVYGQSAISGVGVLDITDDINTPVVIVAYVPGASSGVAVDDNFNLVFGNGYDYDTTDISLTGELRVWPASTWWNSGTGTPVGNLLNYLGDEGIRIADQVLSSAHLGFDEEGNLHVGGGQFYGVPLPTDENGYAVLINQKVVADALTNGPDLVNRTANLMNEAKGYEYREIAADVCQNDSATTVLANGRSITVGWNPTNATCTIGGADDWWGPGIAPQLTTYTIDETRDGDVDGYYDINDTSPGTYDLTNADTDGDGYGNIIDGDFNDDDLVNVLDLTALQGDWGNGTYPETDMNSDGVVNVLDLTLLQGLWGAEAPYYNF